MLILPLHRPLNRATFPFVTAALVLVNLLVFIVFQLGDPRRIADLREWYEGSMLAGLEWPIYLDYAKTQAQRDRSDAEDLQSLDEDPATTDSVRASVLFSARLSDARLDRALREAAREPLAGAAAASDPFAAARARLEAEFDARARHILTLRYSLRYSEIAPSRMFGAAFLHGGWMHLFGNLFFLVALGLLVEGALGELRFALLYLAGIFGSSLFALVWTWGDSGTALGASGAISALMGAFCVLWGRRPVRFFWWFFVVFDYVRAPAIWLLPAWVGWEGLNLLFNHSSNIGFSAHLGGLLSGALVGWMFVVGRQVRTDFLADPEAPRRLGDEIDEARRLLGRMALPSAEAALAGLAAAQPQNFEVAVLRYRAAALAGRRADLVQRCLVALTIPAADGEQAAAQYRLLEESVAAAGDLPDGPWRLSLRRRWLALRRFDEVEALQVRWPGDSPASAREWFELALARRDAGQLEAFEKTLQQLVERFPRAPEAAKARFLLNPGG